MFPVRSFSKFFLLAGIALCLTSADGNTSFAAPSAKAVPVPAGALGDALELNDQVRPAASQEIHLSFDLKTAPIAQIQSYVSTLTDPKSPNYHHWLTPAAFGAKFGASQADTNAVVAYLNANGMTDVKVWPDHVIISATTTRQQAEAAFGVTMHGYLRNQTDVTKGMSATYYAPDQLPLVDAGVASKLVAIEGLSTKRSYVPMNAKAALTPAIGIYGSLDPPDLAEAYNITDLHGGGLEGQGQTIDIFSPTAVQLSDIQSFFALEGLPMPTVNVESVDGGTDDLTNQAEACLDIETIGGQAPDATINVVEGPFGADLYEQIEADDPECSSESWADFEVDESQAYASTYETLHQAISAEGVTMFVAAGDWGAFEEGTNTVTVNLDAALPEVTAVGGTELKPLSNGNWNGEVAWTYNDGTAGDGWGGGGGLSIYFPEPAWQTGPGVNNINSDGFRQLPDISALASSPYYDVYTMGAFNAYLGTSASCPLWASSVLLIEQGLNQRLGNINPLLYQFGGYLQPPYHDITSGNDGLYFCTPNWDFVTGWGSADFGKLYTAFGGTFQVEPPVITSLSPTGAPVNGKKFTLEVFGEYFTAASVIEFNGVALPTKFVSSAELTATIPSSDLGIIKSCPVVVNTPYTGAGKSNTYLFYVQGPSTSRVAASVNPLVYGQPTVLTAKVFPSSATGSVEFITDSGNSLVGLTNGTATYTATNLPVGTTPVTAEYLGAGLNGAATSSATEMIVKKESAALTLSTSANPATTSKTITLTSHITCIAPGNAPFIDDFVAFYDGNTYLGSGFISTNPVTLANTATLSIVGLAAGKHNLRSQFEGDAYTVYETSPTVVETITAK
jgi:kumamolisin